MSPPGSSIVSPATWNVPPGRALIRNGFWPQTPSHLQYWSGMGSFSPQRSANASIWAAVIRGFWAKRAYGPPGAMSRMKYVIREIPSRTGIAWIARRTKYLTMASS